uniref:Uncharacterized protein n=1 Tax=Anopheles farauti TaxID=69004 RepID=A0A182QRB8_9DIPT
MAFECNRPVLEYIKARWKAPIEVVPCLENTAPDVNLGSSSSTSSSSKAGSSPNNGLVPRFTSRGHTYRAVVGDTLVLPCEVENLVFYVRVLHTESWSRVHLNSPVLVMCLQANNAPASKGQDGTLAATFIITIAAVIKYV